KAGPVANPSRPGAGGVREESGGAKHPAAADAQPANGAGTRQHAAGIDGHGRDEGAGHVENALVDVGVTGVSARARQRQRAAADLGQPAPGCAGAGAALEPSGTAIADDAADCGTEVVAADGELVRAEKIIARAPNRPGADIAASSRPGRVGEIDDAAGAGDELRIAASAVVVE